jgi:hypothetical protein
MRATISSPVITGNESPGRDERGETATASQGHDVAMSRQTSDDTVRAEAGRWATMTYYSSLTVVSGIDSSESALLNA